MKRSYLGQGCGSDPYPDPDSIGSLDLESGSRRAKMTHKSRKKIIKVMF
jgi:hypothetical protein